MVPTPTDGPVRRSNAIWPAMGQAHFGQAPETQHCPAQFRASADSRSRVVRTVRRFSVSEDTATTRKMPDVDIEPFQDKARDALTGPATRVRLSGGRCSGNTHLIILWLARRALCALNAAPSSTTHCQLHADDYFARNLDAMHAWTSRSALEALGVSHVRSPAISTCPSRSPRP